MAHDSNTVATVFDEALHVGSVPDILKATSTALLESFGGVPTSAARLVLPAELGLRIAGISSSNVTTTMPIVIVTSHDGDEQAGLLAGRDEETLAVLVHGSGLGPVDRANGMPLGNGAANEAFVASAEMIAATQIAIADVMVVYIVRHLAEEEAKKKGRWVDQSSKHELADVVIERDIAEAHLAHAREVGVHTAAGRRYLILSLLAAGGAATAAVAAGRRTAVDRADADSLAGVTAAQASVDSLTDAAGRPVSLRTALYRATKGH